MDVKLDQIKISNDSTYHTYQSKPLYPNRFLSVQKFHPPGLAPVESETGSYHINIKGDRVYQNTFQQCFGFYYDRAAVKEGDDWFHILSNGEPLYKERYAWCGNYQDSVCVVRGFDGAYQYIDLEGDLLFADSFSYAGDFRDGVAVIQNQKGQYTHIDKRGTLIHRQWFQDLDVFHKGHARAKDESGWFHIDKNGASLYDERFLAVEDFYNGQARVEKITGEIQVISPTAEVIHVVRDAQNNEFQMLSADLVGYWKTQTIKAAVDLNVFDALPSSQSELARKIGIKETHLVRLMRALTELNLVFSKNNVYYPTSKAAYLNSQHPLSLVEAAKHWGGSHYMAWSHLTDALKGDDTVYANLFEKPLFDWLDEDSKRVAEYQCAMRAYARHDYEKIASMIDLKACNTAIDAGGGMGFLLFSLLKENPNLMGALYERASVLELVSIPNELKERAKLQSFDLFKPWPDKADVIFLCRVLHDWDDESAIKIMKNARDSLNSNGKLVVVEFLLDKNIASGGMLDLNMLVIAGARERMLEDYTHMGREVGLNFHSRVTVGNYHVMEFA